MDEYTTPQSELKCCSVCGQYLPPTTEYFPKRSKTAGGGLNAFCKKCDNKRAARYREKNKERTNAQSRERMRRFRETEKFKCPEEVEKRKQYREDNIERIRELDRRRNQKSERKAWYRKRDQSPQRQEYKRNHRNTQEYREIMRAVANRRRAKERSRPVDFPSWKWNRCLEYWGHKCAICGRQIPNLFGDLRVSADHWIPLHFDDSPGTVTTNMIPLCHGITGCNNSKGISHRNHG